MLLYEKIDRLKCKIDYRKKTGENGGENHKIIPRYHLPLVGRHLVYGLVTAPSRTDCPAKGTVQGQRIFTEFMHGTKQ